MSSTSSAKKALSSLRKGYSNPAFQMMGIKRIRLPSRNWLIFWCVLGGGVGGVVYDKYIQKQQRRKYMAFVSHYGEEEFPVDRVARKVRIYAAPPPSDYMSETLKYFRRYVKPLLNSAGIDFEMVTEDRQGRIRNAVAEEIRKLRRAKLGLPDITPEKQAELKRQEEEKKAEEEAKNKPLMGINPSFGLALNTTPPPPPMVENGDELKPLKELYKPEDVLGLTKLLEDQPKTKVVSEDQTVWRPQEAGGVICIGRGSFKEYINGVHEGLLGPLYAPEWPKVERPKDPNEKPDSELSEKQLKKRQAIRKKQEEEDADKPEPPYIMPNEYSEYDVAPELNIGSSPRDDKGIPYFFLQPILLLRIYSVAGFTKQLERIRRFYTKRNQQVDYSERLYGLVEKKFRPFVKEDQNWEIEEEDDWPGPWVKRGKEKNSEWCQEFVVDERVTSIFSVYEKEKMDITNVEAKKEKKKEKKERKEWVKYE